MRLAFPNAVPGLVIPGVIIKRPVIKGAACINAKVVTGYFIIERV